MKWFMGSLMATAIAVFSLPVHGQLACDTRENIMRVLLQTHGEKVVVRLIDGRGRLVEFTASEDGDTWTMLMTDPIRQVTCVLAAGRDLETMRPFLSVPDEPVGETYGP